MKIMILHKGKTGFNTAMEDTITCFAGTFMAVEASV